MLAFNAAISARSSCSIHILFIFYYIYLSAVVYKAVIILYKTSYYLFLGIQKRHVTLLSSLVSRLSRNMS